MFYSFHKKNFNLEWDEENGIVSLQIIGDQDETGSANLYEALLFLSHKLEDQKDIADFKVLNDISKAKKITRQALRIQATFLRDFRIKKNGDYRSDFF